jgi:hypothetical protein
MMEAEPATRTSGPKLDDELKVQAPEREQSRPTDQAARMSQEHPPLQWQRMLGNRAVHRMLGSTTLQTKLTIGAPDDLHEREADEVAEEVTSAEGALAGFSSGGARESDDDDVRRKLTPDRSTSARDLLRRVPIRTLQRTLGNRAFAQLLRESFPAAEGPAVQRKCACGGESGEECAERRAKRLSVQRVSTGGDAGLEAPPIVEEVLGTPGQPLGESVRRTLEPGFGHNFSQVRVHDDAKAAQAASSVSALAYTVGNHIVFGADFSGVRIHADENADELNHTLQGEAFTTGRDIYFRRGTHQPPSAVGRKLLAHQRYLAGSGLLQRAGPAGAEKTSPQAEAAIPVNKIAFVREEGLNLHAAPDQHSASLNKLKFGQRVYLVEDSNPQPSWLKIAVQGQTGYAFAPRIHFPPENLIQKDPGLRLIKVRSGLSLWALVKEMYGIEGNESTKDQNMNHFINAIRAVNKDEAFNLKTDTLDDIGNFFLSGRDAKDTYLKANYDLWIPSFGVAARMDVGSGTVRGEITRFVKKIEQKIDDFKEACRMSVAYMPEAIAKRAGEVGMGLLQGLLEFAKDAVKILAISTAIGALIGALFGGVGAIPGAEIGFEIGLLILEYYGLAMLIEAVLSIAVDLIGQLGKFISLVWDASGDKKQLDLAARTLADVIGILVSAVLIAAAAYLLKKGGEALRKTKFAQTVGETRLAQWFKERQQFKTTLGEEKAPPKRTKRTPDVKPSAPKGWKGTLNEFGEKIQWPARGKIVTPAEAVDLAVLHEASVTQEWASEQAAIYREVARMNRNNPTAALRADWLEKIAKRLGGPK